MRRGAILHVTAPDFSDGIATRALPDLGIEFTGELFASEVDRPAVKTSEAGSWLRQILGGRLRRVEDGEGAGSKRLRLYDCGTPVTLSGLRPGAWFVVSIVDPIGGVLQQQRVQIKPEGERTEVHLAAPTAASGQLSLHISGEDPSHLPIIQAKLREPGDWRSVYLGRQEGTGSWTVPFLKAGSFEVVAEAEGYVTAHELFQQTPEGTDLKVTMRRARRLSVEFRDEAGAPVSPSSLRATGIDGAIHFSRRHDLTPKTSMEDVPLRGLTLQARFGTRTREFLLPDTVTDVVLDAPTLGRIEVFFPAVPSVETDWGDVLLAVADERVLGPLDPMPGRDVSLLPAGAWKVDHSFVRDAKGPLTLRIDTGPGRYQVLVALKGGEESQLIERVLIQKEIVVRAGEVTVLRGDT